MKDVNIRAIDMGNTFSVLTVCLIHYLFKRLIGKETVKSDSLNTPTWFYVVKQYRDILIPVRTRMFVVVTNSMACGGKYSVVSAICNYIKALSHR